MGGWEVEPDGQQRTPGQILSRHVQQAYGIVKKIAPEAQVWTWSDMFTPLHNARPYQEGKKVNGYYWLVNGNWMVRGRAAQGDRHPQLVCAG